MAKIICPRCGQDYVVKAVVIPLKKNILICPECDACWWPDEPVSLATFTDFTVLMEGQGIIGDWNMLELFGILNSDDPSAY